VGYGVPGSSQTALTTVSVPSLAPAYVLYLASVILGYLASQTVADIA